ncbi:hypothetical protein [Pseudidiomarina sediminum]|uniref:hypothetical protein n=1 Tax=Pseudidiomarina sediminum TaxID=431675 RepID=UPI001C957DF6|nr:hypothetical protein [Pseudidiomarina sediminum]MBY6063802.1 hypothetical protein [Pseudidiomarina sediminum]
MKTRFKLAATALLGVVIGSGCSEVHEYIIEGDVLQFEASFYEAEQSQRIEHFQIEAELEFWDDDEPYIDTFDTQAYEAVLARFEGTFSGEALSFISAYPRDFPGANYNRSVFSKANGTDEVTFQVQYQVNDLTISFGYTMTQAMAPLVNLTRAYPQLFAGEYRANASYFGSVVDSQQQVLSEVSMQGFVNRISALLGDADGDGVDDGIDACLDSQQGGEVALGPFNSGVDNVMGGDGCSLVDRYMACQADEYDAGAPWLSYSGPSYCEQQVAYDAYREGMIDYTEVRLLRTMVNQYHRSQNNFS